MILAYILIIILLVAVVYLWREVKKIKATSITLKENDLGEVILKYKGEEIINYKTQE